MLVRRRETRFDQPSEIYLAMQPFYGAASPPLIIGGILGPMGVGNAPAVVFLEFYYWPCRQWNWNFIQ